MYAVAARNGRQQVRSRAPFKNLAHDSPVIRTWTSTAKKTRVRNDLCSSSCDRPLAADMCPKARPRSTGTLTASHRNAFDWLLFVIQDCPHSRNFSMTLLFARRHPCPDLGRRHQNVLVLTMQCETDKLLRPSSWPPHADFPCRQVVPPAFSCDALVESGSHSELSLLASF